MTAPSAYPWEAPATGPAAALSARLGALVPRIETTRLLLRAPELRDFGDYAEILMSDRARFMDGPFDRNGAWQDFTQYVAGWILRGAGVWTVEDKATGTVTGFVSVAMEFGDQEHELGYMLTAEAEGQGIATEAVAAVRSFALDTHDLPSLVSYVDPDNAKSTDVARRVGATRDAQAESVFNEPVHVYRYVSSDNDGGMEAYA
ncbi:MULTISPECIES: GNAT family N-acetyltransferase [unclassified Ruegeria]|uniref:GNAT family N-acetyltransferase n=1 Tax=unclassified Ruegeria TaxID=2625375 RepID=UPI001490F954|nr:MULTISPECIES: GNAT family N-acetyltransferase [unclassified Ruegeria]NOD36345.1 GNAT family N-acetyltransferase [Ruegeria sp. HKCCD7296]NOE42454.1 GNAT family N-acetyltransferase [Ruegeria sp. HKCCD7319]